LRLAKIIVFFSLLLVMASPVLAETDSAPVLPKSFGKFKQIGPVATVLAAGDEGEAPSISASALEEAEYVATDGSRVMIGIARFLQDSEAYELLSLTAQAIRHNQPDVEVGSNVGTAGFARGSSVWFFKGRIFVRVRAVKGKLNLTEVAQAVSETLDKGEADIPSLIKHLPAYEEAQKKAVYLNSFSDLDQLGLRQPVLSAVEAGGNGDAVLASYGSSKVLIVEFNTPQLATENDQRTIARIHELWDLGQPAPTAYRRVGNYSVFVFDAPDEQTAKQLIEQVKYEQVVTWLGDNPNILKEAQKQYVNTTLGVLVAVLKASGYAAVACLGMGGLIGGLLFTYRRAQQKGETAFSDAGGMLRLNLDELTPETDPARLLRERN
jgi:hypothetical protein